jgi:hypothetical protein
VTAAASSLLGRTVPTTRDAPSWRSIPGKADAKPPSARESAPARPAPAGRRWRDKVKATVGDRVGLGPREVAAALSETLASMPVFCDLLTHVAVSLEGDVGIERARRYKASSFAAHDEMVSALDDASAMTADQIRALVAAAMAFAATFWQVSHPTPTLAALYEQVPEWGHVALDFAPRLRLLLEATAIGLAEALPPGDGG